MISMCVAVPMLSSRISIVLVASDISQEGMA